jgi:lipoprotein-releasing system permease protein
MSDFTFAKKVAFRYLWSKRSEAFISIISIISVLGVAIGVMVLTIVMSVMTGFEYELREKIVGADSHIIVKKLGDKIVQWRDARATIEGLEGVVSASPYTQNQGMLRSEDKAVGILVRGVERGSAGASQLASYTRTRGGIEPLFSPPPIVVSDPDTQGEREVTLPGLFVGKDLAVQLGLLPGTPLSILSPSVGSSPFGLVPKFRRFVVAGTYSSGLSDYDSALGYVALEEAQRFFQLGDAVSGFEVRVKNVDEAPQIAKKIVDALGGYATGLYAQDWTERNRPLWEAIKLEKRVYFIVLLLIIVMASFSIVTTLIMIVLEKRRDIAVLRTLGASGKSVALIFVIQGSTLGGVGTLLGLLLGYVGCTALTIWGFPLDAKVFQMSSLPIRMELANFILVGCAAFVIASGATLYPAHRASKLQPADAFRFE